MIKMNSKITINQGLLNRLSKATVKALEQTGEALHTEVEQAQVMPRDTGTLQNEKTFVDCHESNQGRVSIISEGPYARRLYFHPEYNFRKDKNPNARGEWYKPWLPGGEHSSFAQKAFAENYRREAGT